MSLSKISPSNRKAEFGSLENIYDCIDTRESILFNSGAGAGKTYALIESLKYVIRNYDKPLKKHNRNIICITYTNVATNEVKERLGNTDLVLISTIHERIWTLIKDYRRELVQIHKEKLIEEISSLERIVGNGKEYELYRKLEDKEKQHFTEIMIENRELFYQNINVKAADFRLAFQKLLNDFSNLLSNISNFRKTVSAIYKIDNYNKCLENIKLKKPKYNKVEYNSIYNSDQLHRMRISHDTLLDYGLKIIDKYDLLKQIIIDKYPFIFIDEYQDTNEKVVLIMNKLDKYSKKIGRNIFIGYFGDSAQNIYDEGVGNKILEIHSDLKEINKEFNRRSTKEVIEVINKIRNDNIVQVSIYDDCDGGSVKFYKGSSENVRDFIDKYVLEWQVSLKNPLHCLVLTNKIVAEYSGFINIYDVFASTDIYKGFNYSQLNTELLSKDLSKLGEVPRLLFNIVKLYNDVSKDTTPVIQLSPNEYFLNEMNFLELKKLIRLLKECKGSTLGEYIKSIATVYNKTNDNNFKKIIEWTFGIENISPESIRNFIIEKLFPNLLEDDIEHANTTSQKLLDIKIDEFELWYKFILDKEEKKEIYHTYHGTKGREFENVVIILENAFGRNKNYFNFFFDNLNNFDTLELKDKQTFEKIKNLLYVSCSRAIKNLRILYIDDISNFESGIKGIFGEIYSFGNNS